MAELARRIDDELTKAGGGAAIDYGALEQYVANALGEVERGLHAQALARLNIDVPAIGAWGDEYRRIGQFESDYHTLAGTIYFARLVDEFPYDPPSRVRRTVAVIPCRIKAYWRPALGSLAPERAPSG